MGAAELPTIDLTDELVIVWVGNYIPIGHYKGTPLSHENQLMARTQLFHRWLMSMMSLYMTPFDTMLHENVSSVSYLHHPVPQNISRFMTVTVMPNLSRGFLKSSIIIFKRSILRGFGLIRSTRVSNGRAHITTVAQLISISAASIIYNWPDIYGY